MLARRGFTLIEMVVIVAIVAFLVSALAATCSGLRNRSKLEGTRALLRGLDAGCASYQSKLGQLPGAPTATADTTVLYQALCVPRVATAGDAAAGPARLVGPFCEMPGWRIGNAPQIHDDWGWPVRYTMPGKHHRTAWDIDASSADAGTLGNWNLGE